MNKLYRIHVHAEIDAQFEVTAENPENAVMVTAAVEPKTVTWLTLGRVVAIEEKTPSGWKALSPEESALVQEVEQ